MSEEFLDIQATIKCGFTLKRVREMTRTYSQSRTEFLLPPQHLTNFERHKYRRSEPRFISVYSRSSLPKINDGLYAINLYETHWIAFYVNDDNEGKSNDII